MAEKEKKGLGPEVGAKGGECVGTYVWPDEDDVRWKNRPHPDLLPFPGEGTGCEWLLDNGTFWSVRQQWM